MAHKTQEQLSETQARLEQQRLEVGAPAAIDLTHAAEAISDMELRKRYYNADR